MNQHIDTIPVWDAYKTDCECPLCVLAKKNEDNYVDLFLGASVMEPDRRVAVNEKGFCRRHFKMMFDINNKLGLALMTDTYMKRIIEKLSENAKTLTTAGEGEGKKNFVARMGKKSEDFASCAAQIKDIADQCILCDQLNTTMQRYAYTVMYMYKHDGEFREALKNSKGFCLDHYAMVLDEAPKQLSGKELQDFIDMVTELELTHLKRVESELEWFTLKKDYRNADKPWGNSKDAVERSLNKLRGGTL